MRFQSVTQQCVASLHGPRSSAISSDGPDAYVRAHEISCLQQCQWQIQLADLQVMTAHKQSHHT